MRQRTTRRAARRSRSGATAFASEFVTASAFAACAALLAASLTAVPAAASARLATDDAVSVEPMYSTATADCDYLGSNITVDFTATGGGLEPATMTVVLVGVTINVGISPNSLGTTLTFRNLTTGLSDTFSGTINPYIGAGQEFVLGPLSGDPQAGDVLEFYGGSLQINFYGVIFTCHADYPQSVEFVYS